MIRIWLILTTVWLLALWLINVNGNFPLNDDWQYAFAVRNLLETGELNYQGQFSPIVLVQVIWGALFCKLTSADFNFTTLRWSTLVLVPFLVASFFKLSQWLSLTRESVVVLGIAIYFTPLMMVLAPSFMSDVPFAFVSVLAVLSYWKFTVEKQKGWLFLAVILSGMAFYIRQPGMVLPVAFGVHYWWMNGRQRTGLIQFFVLIVCSLGLLFSWEWWVKPGLGLSENFKSDMASYLVLMLKTPISFFKTLVLRLLKSFIYLGLFSLPFAPFIWPKQLGFKKWAVALIMGLLLVITAHLAGKTFPFGGNIFYNFGLGPELLADVYTHGLANTPVLPNIVMYLLHFMAAVWAIVLVFMLFQKWNELSLQHRSYLQLWLILSAMYFPLMAITSYYDRYVLLPMLLLWPILMIDLKKLKFLSFRWLPMVIVVYFSITATHDYLAWNRAKLDAFHWLQDQGVSIQQMDAGYELNGWNNYGAPRILNDTTSFWWVTDDQYLLTFGDIPNYEPIHQLTYQRWLWAKEDSIFILKR